MAPEVKRGMTRQELVDLYNRTYKGLKSGTVVSGASQVWRFVNEIQEGDQVVTYSPANRTYLVGRVVGEARYWREGAESGMALVRSVEWQEVEVQRDALSSGARNSLGSTLTVFLVPDSVSKEVIAKATGNTVAALPGDVSDVEPDTAADPLADLEEQAVERIKDVVSGLDAREMEQLVAGILRAMGYKTNVSPVGADRGKDIIASPDGFGFENPRIVVEVKHRSGQMGSQAIRSFLGGRHKDDRGLYVSTGGFTKDAWYEADRATVPLALWTLDHLVRALLDNYGKVDAETKRMVPLKMLYWPA